MIQDQIKKLFIKTISRKSVGNILPTSSVYNSLAAEAKKPGERGTLIVLIVLESFGLNHDKTLKRFFVSNIEDAIKPALRVRGYSISRLSNDASLGGTLGAELRYLCNLRTYEAFESYKKSSSALKLSTSKCLPRLIRMGGGLSIYIHNGSKRFYKRDRIMPLVGFNRSYFQRPSLIHKRIIDCLTMPFCGNDEESYSTAESIITTASTLNGQQSKAKLFIQIMTINTHAPYQGSHDVISAYKEKVANSSTLLRRFLVKIVDARKNLPTFILVTSDHPAPLGFPAGKSQKVVNLPHAQQSTAENPVYLISN